MLATVTTVSAIITNAAAFQQMFTKFTSLNKNQFSLKDQQLLQGIERRINSLLQPLNICAIRNESLMKPAITSAL